jgi:DNA (cytosine-5)-methyltransferase 1
VTEYQVIDLCGGAGGWAVGADRLHLTHVGIEVAREPVATCRAAGHPVIPGDIRAMHPRSFPGAVVLVASPPCQTFSTAGSGSGRDSLAAAVAHVAEMAEGPVARPTGDARTWLVLEPLRWALTAIRLGIPYTGIGLEQVPSVLPVWEAIARVLREHDYTVRTGLVHAEQYGVPQTRTRAVLMAVSGDTCHWPQPTHSKYYSHSPERLDPGRIPWVSMAQALGWDGVLRSNYGTHNNPGDKALRGADQPATTLTSKISRMRRFSDETLMGDVRTLNGTRRLVTEPAPTIPAAMDNGNWRWMGQFADQSRSDVDVEWPLKRPSTTVATRAIVQHPGHTRSRFDVSTKSRNDGVRVTVAEAAVLQGFPEDYPWRGNRSSVYRQVGNAIPPPMAAAILRGLIT